MRRILLIMIFVLVFFFGSIFVPSINAETFNIGKRISESEPDSGGYKWYTFDSGAMIGTNPNYINYTQLIFDGNESTGLNHSFGPGHDRMLVFLVFPYPFNITNITMKPVFKGNSSEYLPFGNLLIYSRAVEIWYEVINFKNITIQLNFKVDTIRLWLDSNGTNNFSFNDVIINYTPTSSNFEGIQKQINQINKDINSIYSDIIIIKKDINDIKANITNIKNNIPSEYNDSALKEQINNLTKEINSLKENLTNINNNLSMGYNDSTIKSNIFNLESENVIFKQNIENLTLKIENITTELEKLESEVQNLGQIGPSKNDDKESGLSQYYYNVIFGVILIILLLIILKLSMTIYKRKQHEMENLEPDDVLMNKIKHEMITNNKMKDPRLYDDEVKLMLEKKHRKGDMSEETYNYIKTVLDVPKEPQDIKDKKS